MATNETYKNLLFDIESYFKSDAADAKQSYEAMPTDPFSQGELAAYEEVLQWMQEQEYAGEERHMKLAESLGLMLRQRALDLKEGGSEIEHDLFNRGKLLSYYSMIKWLRQQSELFGIPLDQMHLDDIVPDRDLM